MEKALTIYYLYKIVNSVNEKVYIGISKNPENRFKQHLHKNSNCTKLKHAIKKYGKESFYFETLCAGSEEYIIDLEVKAIIAYDSIMNGYNLILGNPRTGAISLAEETKRRISEGLNKFYSENIAWNHGVVLGRRKEFDPCYVTGFWFPHPQDAISKLNLDVKTYHKWSKEGTLGDIQHLSKDNVADKPCYVGGFWFNTLHQACISLVQNKATLMKRIRTGNIEQKNQKIFKTGEENHMTGRTGDMHHNSKPVYIEGVRYGSISEASRKTKYSKKILYKRLKDQVQGFSWDIN